jgi:hypothetical protein
VLLLQFPGAQPSPFPPVARCLLSCRHIRHSRTSRATFSNRHGDQ